MVDEVVDELVVGAEKLCFVLAWCAEAPAPPVATTANVVVDSAMVASTAPTRRPVTNLLICPPLSPSA